MLRVTQLVSGAAWSPELVGIRCAGLCLRKCVWIKQVLTRGRIGQRWAPLCLVGDVLEIGTGPEAWMRGRKMAERT